MSAPCPICDCERLAKVQDDAGGGASFAVAFMLGRAFEVDAIKERLCPRHRNRWLLDCMRADIYLNTEADETSADRSEETGQ